MLLLGASGLLGHNVLQRLEACGHEVRVLVRRANAVRLDGGGWQTVVGRLDEPGTVAAAAEGCEAIVNCAGTTDMSLRRLEDYMPVNRDLCQTIVDTMERLGIKRVVHASTVNTIGNGTSAHPADESVTMSEPFAHSLYAQSKQAGEAALLAAAHRHTDWHVVVVNPGYMLGPMDAKPSSGRMLLMGYRRRTMLAPCGGKAFVDVRDVAAAMVGALERGRNGERYIAVGRGGQFGIGELYRLQAKTMGYRQRVLTIPGWAMLAAGALGDTARWLGIRTELSTNNMRQLMTNEHYDSSRAVEELGMTETPLEQSIRDFHAWRNEQKNKQKRHTT